MELERTLTVEELKRLEESRARNPRGGEKHAFWAGPMPSPSERPTYHSSIKKLYDDFLDPPLEYVDAYHPIVCGAPVFNETIQDILIRDALYIVADLSLPRHDVIFEAGFGLAAGIQTIFYFDAGSSIRRKYPNDSNRFTSLSEVKKLLPPEIRDVIFAQPPRRIPEGERATKSSLGKLAPWFNSNVHSPGFQLPRRRCCKIHFEDRECEFTKQLASLSREPTERYYLINFQEGHEDQEHHVEIFLQRRGLRSVENLTTIVDNSAYLCRTCFFLHAADRIIVDGTSALMYNEHAAESAFMLGMAVAIVGKTMKESAKGKSTKKSAKIKMLYEEGVGPIGMFAGGRASWQSEKWRDQIDRELEDW